MSGPLPVMVSFSFQTGIIRYYLKTANVNPLHKKESCDNTANYTANYTGWPLSWKSGKVRESEKGLKLSGESQRI